MYPPPGDLYQQTKAIKLGQYHLDPFYQEFVDWVGNQFSVKALNFGLTTNASYHQQFVNVVFERSVDCALMEKRTHDRELLTRFVPVLTSPNRPHDPTKTEVLSAPTPGINQELHGTYSSFELGALDEAKSKMGLEYIRQLEKAHKDVIWKISGDYNSHHVVFYHTEAIREQCMSNGISDQIADAFLKEYKKVDEFDYFTSDSVALVFDSKETLDSDFGGQEGYYFR